MMTFAKKFKYLYLSPVEVDEMWVFIIPSFAITGHFW